ncbi:uncharacterized protein LOC135488990 [Lineus longissimus]|uniref:uncharacterized protein LOC135488990 n=1 Tax=Lineus longissimus TaxID=88925 RepID=UPI00315DE53D
MSTTGTSAAAANFIKTYTHDQFIKPSKKIYHAKADLPYSDQKCCDVQLSNKILPLVGNLQFEHREPLSLKSSSGSLNFQESVSKEGEERESNDSSSEDSDEVDNGDQVPELLHPRHMYQPDLSGSPKKNVELDIDKNAQVYLQGRGHRRRASAPVNIVMEDLTEQDEPTTVPAVSKDEGDVPDTPLRVIELMKQEAAIMSQVKLRRMKHLEYRRGSCMPAVRSSPDLQGMVKPISSERVHQVMKTLLYGPQTKKKQQELSHFGVHDPAVKSSKIEIPVLGGHAGSPPRQPAIPVAPPPPEIMPSALIGDQKDTPCIPEAVQAPVEWEKPKLTEVVATIHIQPTVSLPIAEDFAEVTARRQSSLTQDLEDTFKKLDRTSGEFSDSGSFTQSGESCSGGSTSWFGGLIGLRPAPVPRKPGEARPAPVKKKVKKRDLNAFAPAGF